MDEIEAEGVDRNCASISLAQINSYFFVIVIKEDRNV
jgi:hypothetical protein